MRDKMLWFGMGLVIGLLLAATGMTLAGSPNPGAGPTAAASQMYTLQQIYDRINNGAAAAKMTTFTEPAAASGSTMVTLDQLYTLAGQRSRPPRTGQINFYGTRDDGSLRKGVVWPDPRFTDNGNGTVTDNLTGLIWLKNANCFGIQNWPAALNAANTLNNGECGLTDGSAEGDWRLPNVRELHSLIDYGQAMPVLPSGHPFTGVQSNNYWTSTTNDISVYAWYVNLNDGQINFISKAQTYYVWPVRGGQ